MAGKNINNILIPNVTQLPGQKKVDLSNKINHGNQESVAKANEFKSVLSNELNTEALTRQGQEHGINLSVHAARRLQERDLAMNTEEFFKIKDAMAKLKEKGSKDSLVVTKNAAYIVDVQHNKVVTAIDKAKMAENVFTKIDSTVFMD